MRKSDFIFWTILALIALFYILKGNDIHRDYYKHIEEQAKSQNLNKEALNKP